MNQLLIQHYLNHLQTLRRVSGTSQESVVREAFKTLLKDWGKSRDLIFLPEYEYETLTKTRVRPDGTLMYALRVPFGYWEAKDILRGHQERRGSRLYRTENQALRYVRSILPLGFGSRRRERYRGVHQQSQLY